MQPLLLLLLVVEQLKVEGEVSSVEFSPIQMPMALYQVLALLLWMQCRLQQLWAKKGRGADQEAVVVVTVVEGAARVQSQLQQFLLLPLVALPCLPLLL